MKKYLIMFMLCCSSLAFARDTYVWHASACARVNDNGRIVQYVDDSYCDVSQGSSYAWASSGTCAKVTPEGQLIRYVSKSFCEDSEGYFYVVYDGWACAKVTPDGRIIEFVDRSPCGLD